jgi:hypothetical protein
MVEAGHLRRSGSASQRHGRSNLNTSRCVTRARGSALTRCMDDPVEILPYDPRWAGAFEVAGGKALGYEYVPELEADLP